MRVKYKEKNEHLVDYGLRKEHIKNAEADLITYGNKEALALFLIMKEIGIRLEDLVELTPENLNDRELIVIEHKLNRIYAYTDGTKPVISEGTVNLLVIKESGRYFEHDSNYYIQIFRRAVKNKKFRHYHIRDYVLRSCKIV